MDVDLSSKGKSAPRLLVFRNEDRKINNAYLVGDGISIEVGKDIKISHWGDPDDLLCVRLVTQRATKFWGFFRQQFWNTKPPFIKVPIS